MIDFGKVAGLQMRAISGLQGFATTGKSQADQIQLLRDSGWTEDQKSHDIRRWREPRTKALYSLKDAVSLIRYRSNKK